MNFIKNIRKKSPKKIVTLFTVLIICFGIVGGCGANGPDPDRSDPDSIVDNFLISIVNTDQRFANACQVGTIQIDTESLPTNTFVDVEFVPGFNTLGACVLDSSVIIDSQGRAFLDFIANYATLDISPTGSFRILLTATTPEGQIITQFADIVLEATGILPPVDDNGSSTFSLDITINEMGVDEIPFLVLQFATQGIKPGTEVEFTTSNPPLGGVDVNPAIVSGNVNSGAFTTTYFPNTLAGTNLLTATITLDTPQEILDQCDVVDSSIEISAIITIVQSVTINESGGGDDGMMDGM